MDITENNLFDYNANIKKAYGKFIKHKSFNKKYIDLFDTITKILEPYEIKLYVSTMNLINIIQQENISDDDLHEKYVTYGSDIYHTNTNIMIEIKNFDDLFSVMFFIDKECILSFFAEIKICYDNTKLANISVSFYDNDKCFTSDDNNHSDEFIKSKNDFFTGATKRTHTNIYVDYLQLCDDNQQKYMLTQINNSPSEKETLMENEINELKHKIINLEYECINAQNDNNIINDYNKQSQVLILSQRFRNEHKRNKQLQNKINIMNRPHTLNTQIIYYFLWANALLYGFYFMSIINDLANVHY